MLFLPPFLEFYPNPRAALRYLAQYLTSSACLHRPVCSSSNGSRGSVRVVATDITLRALSFGFCSARRPIIYISVCQARNGQGSGNRNRQGRETKDQGRKNSQARQCRTAKAGKVRHPTEPYQRMCSCGLEQVSAPTPEARRCCQNCLGRPGQVASRRAAQWRCRAMSQIRPACTGAWEPGRPPC